MSLAGNKFGALPILSSMSLAVLSNNCRTLPFQGPDAVMIQRQLADTMLAHPEIYEAMQCASNVRSLLKNFTDPVVGQYINVLVFLPRQAQAWEDLCIQRYRLPAPRQSLCKNVLWPHHVLLTSGGRVYDFDYSGTPGTDISHYVDAMFSAAASVIDTIVVPADHFGRSLGDILLKTLYSHQFERQALPLFVTAQRNCYGRQDPYVNLMTRRQSHEAYHAKQAAV